MNLLHPCSRGDRQVPNPITKAACFVPSPEGRKPKSLARGGPTRQGQFGSRRCALRLQRTRPFPRGHLNRGTLSSLLMAFPGTGNKGVTSTDVAAVTCDAAPPAASSVTGR